MSQDYLNHLDLPKPLMMMLGTLKSQYDIKNWSIYCNSNQNTCVVIRFDDMHGCTQPTQYRRVSEKQQARSKARSDLYKQNKNQDIRPLDTNQAKKRKCDKLLESPPEILRMESDSSYICHLDSPDMPDTHRVDEVYQFKGDQYTNLTSNSQMPKVSSDYSDTTQPPVEYILQPSSVDCADHDAAIINSTPKINIEPIPSVPPSVVQTSYTTIGSVPVASPLSSFTTSSQTTTEHSSDDETMLCCPCCNETLSASHQCEIPNISDVSSDSNIHKTDNNQICTPTPDHNHPPSAPPPHSLKHPNPEPPDGSTSTSSKTNELNIDNLLRAFNVVLDKRFSKPK